MFRALLCAVSMSRGNGCTDRLEIYLVKTIASITDLPLPAPFVILCGHAECFASYETLSRFASRAPITACRVCKI